MIESKVVDSIPTLNENDCQIWWARISDLQSWHYNLLNDIERESKFVSSFGRSSSFYNRLRNK